MPFASLGSRTRPSRIVVACLGLAVAATGCHRTIEVRTVTAPTAQFAGRHTVRILEPRYEGSITLGPDDPMMVNSITYSAMRDEIRRAFESRGYAYSTGPADLEIAYYALSRPVTDIRSYGYRYDWRGFPREMVDVVQYQEGTVIIDVVDPATRQLMWRGQGSAAVDTDPDRYTSLLRKAVDKIVERFPEATR